MTILLVTKGPTVVTKKDHALSLTYKNEVTFREKGSYFLPWVSFQPLLPSCSSHSFWQNKLGQDYENNDINISVHHHGVRLDSEYDGHPQADMATNFGLPPGALIRPGKEFT